jgi:ribosomal protein S18 acetylase RimI-like enzyme
MTEMDKVSDKTKRESNTIIIRRAKPTIEEGLQFAGFFDEAAEGFFKSMLGEEAYSILAEAFTKKSNEYSYENVLFAVEENRIIGMISGHSYENKLTFNKKILLDSKTGSKFRVRMFLFLGKILSHYLGPKQPKDFYLQAIAVNSEVRGKGVGSKLMSAGKKMAINEESETLSLDVSVKNKKATSVYKTIGMSHESSWPNLPLIPPVLARMTMEI